MVNSTFVKQQRTETMRNCGTKTQAGVAGGVDSSLVNYTGEDHLTG